LPKRLIQGGALSAVAIVCALAVSGGRVQAQSGTLPAGWASRDIGKIGVAGSASMASGTWTLDGSGANIWSTSDEFRYAYQAVTGDVDIRVRVASLEDVNDWSKAGVMIRESLAANARNAFLFVTPGSGRAFQSRSKTGGSTTRGTTSAGTAPVWLRLVREGSQFTGYVSANGTSWTAAGSATISMTSSAYIGLVVGSRVASTLATATFTDVQTSTAPATSALPAPWTNRDIGSPALAGLASAAGGTFSVSAGGNDIWALSDQFHFVYQPLQGDVEVIARVTSLQYASAWSKAGVMIREDLTAGSRHAFMLASGTQGWHFQRRVATDGTSYGLAGPTGAAPGWVRLVREGNLFSAFSSADGTSWTLVGTDTIAMASTVYVGLAVTSQNTAATAMATFTNVTARTATPGTNQPPTVSIASPSTGATFTAPATFVLTATAGDTDGTITKVDLYEGTNLLKSDVTSPYSVSVTLSTAGTYQLKAVATDSDGETTTSAPVSVTVTSPTNQAPTVSLTTPAAGATFTAPASITIGASASDADGTVSQVDFYQGSTLLASDTTSPYGYTWGGVAAGTYQLTAVARDNGGATKTSAAVSVTVNSATNQAPSVSLTAPASGASFTAPANITLTASASDTDGTVARVEFYSGTTFIGSDTTSPYSVLWTGATAGSYSLTARAVDNGGATRTSAAVSITVTTAVNQLPTVSITSPIAGQSFTAPASLTIGAAASDTDGTIAGVDFYVGTQLIASDSTSPYSAAWTNVAAGSYSLTAVARDNAGGTRTSAAIAVTVTAVAPRPSTLVFTASPDHATNVTSYIVALYRGVDPVTASPVATRDIGKPTPANGDISIDISTLVDPLPAGSYYAVVRASGPGGTTASAPSATFTK
jgi:regulation of enolase protein 1 (concanavalin A-like superfamily)